MKQKLFSIFFVLAISIGTLWAQTSTTTNYTWDELYQEPYEALSGSTTTMYKYVWARGGGNYPAFWFYILFRKSEMVTYNGRTYPAKGNYTISSNLGTPNVIANYQVANTESGSSTPCITEYDVNSSKYYYPISGSGTVAEGADLPYITYSATSNQNANGYTVSSGQYQKIYVNVGSPATYYNVNVVSDNNSYGTVTSTYKSGYVYANNRSQEYKKNSVYTITATPKSGYRFVSWSDGGAQTHDITITGNQTYTATFASLAGQQYTVTTTLNNNSLGSVTPIGYQYENTNWNVAVTINDPANYYLSDWLRDGVSMGVRTNPLPVTVTKAETYTAVITAKEWTLTVNSDNTSLGTVSGSGKYYNGESATLTATPANKLCSFVKWQKNGVDIPGATSATYNFIVSESATYTAVFEGIDATIIDVQAAMTGNSGWDDYTFKYWAKTKDYDIHIIGANITYTEGADFDISNVNTSASHIIDHGITVTLTSDFEGSFYTENGKQVLEAMVTGSNGKKYLLTLRGKNVGDGNLSVGYADNFSQTYSNIYVKEEKETGVWRISGRNGTGETYTTTWCSHFFFATDISKCGDVPNGFYQVDDNGGVGTIITTDNSSYQSYGSYYVQSYIYYDLATGYAEVVNRDENYYIRFEGYHYRGYTHTAQIGTTPYSITGATSEGGHVDIVWHSANCGNVTYTTADMPQKFFSGNSITLTAVADDGYRFDHWADAPANTNPSRDINVSSTGTYTAVFVLDVPAVMHTITINTPTNGTITVMDGETTINSGDQVEEGTVLTVTATPATGYHFDSWTNNGAASVTVNSDVTIGATFAINTYTVTIAKNEDGWGTISATSVANVPYGTVITNEGTIVTINGTPLTATPAANTAQYTYGFSGWTNGTATVNGNMTVTATFTRTTRTYDITWKSEDGASTLNTDEAQSYGTATSYKGATPTKSATGYTYTFDGWTTEPNGAGTFYANGGTPAVSGAATYYAHFTGGLTDYTISYNGLNGATNTNPTSYNVETATIVLADPGTRDGYVFAGWKDESDNTVIEITAGSTGNRTLTATWNAATTLDLYDNQDATYYNNIKDLIGQTYDVTYHRSVAYTSDNGNARWYTLCLPFGVDQSQLTNAGLLRKVYEYRYATGSADVGDQVTFHFRVATSMVAGQGYLVKATGDMGPNFTFTGVTLNTSADVEDGNVDNLKNSNAYKESGNIAIVGVLRSGTLSNDGRKVMGLANNKIWYPHSSGNPMPAYRAYFYNPNASASVMPRVRIVVEGEGETELEVVDGELYDASNGFDADGDGRAPRKYIRNGVLIIERNGVTYDAQGKRL